MKRFDKVTCPDGHEIGTALVNTEPGEGEWVDDIKWTGIPSPILGSSLLCPICERPWLVLVDRVNASGDVLQKRGRVCVNGVWEPPLDSEDRRLWPTA